MTDIVYSIVSDKPIPQRRIIAVLVENEFGVLDRVVGLFSNRGYNIESLSVAEVDESRQVSRITIVTIGSENVIAQIKALLDRMVPVLGVHDLTIDGPFVERELALLKVNGTGSERVEAMRIADIFRARVVDATTESFIFEITGSAEKVAAFTELMRPIGLAEVCRTGLAAMSRGAKVMQEGHLKFSELNG